MIQNISRYVMPEEKEEDVEKMIRRVGLDGIERMVYSGEPSVNPFKRLATGVHLRFWPTWMDFYLGNEKRYRKQFPDRESLTAYYGAPDPDGWTEEIRRNLRAALAENPSYLVWHVADCLVEETWTWEFHYSSMDVLRETARLYQAVADEVPSHVQVLFENVFWPGLRFLLPEEIDYFFSLLPGRNVGLMLDTGHFMNTDPSLETEADGARYICNMIKNMGSMKSLIQGMHLSCSLSGAYRRSLKKEAPEGMDIAALLKHISSIDQHRPFRTEAARQIVEAVEPRFLTHELFSADGGLPEEKIRLQLKAMGKQV